jgi:hypothetical protein
MQRMWLVGVVAVVMVGAAGIGAQDQAERLTVPFSDPSRPGTLNVHIMQGSLTIRGTNRRDVLIEGQSREQTRRSEPAPPGMRRLTQRGSFSVDEQGNVMRLSGGVAPAAPGHDFVVEVPQRTNLKLGLVNSGQLTVEGVEGDIEANNVNGPITLTNVSGSVVAHSTNGKVVATVTRVAAQKAMAFTSLNGGVDVTLPASVKANVKLRSDQGDVFTDFDIQLTTSRDTPVVKDTRQSNGRYRIEVDRALYGTINGGGAEFELRTFNGNVYLRRGK